MLSKDNILEIGKQIDDAVTFCNFVQSSKAFYNACEIIYDDTENYFKWYIYKHMYRNISQCLTEAQWEAIFSYPFDYMGGFEFKKFSKENTISADLKGDYLKDYNNIDKLYYHHEGYNDGDSWYFICQMKNGIYASFDASCDYTGFDCRGDGYISYSDNWTTFCKECITKKEKLLIKNYYNNVDNVNNVAKD